MQPKSPPARFLILLALLIPAFGPTASALPEEPTYPTLLRDAYVHLAAHRYKEAREAFGEILKGPGPDSSQALLGLALAHVHLGDFKKAQKVAREALEQAAETDIRGQAANALGLALSGGSSKKRHLEEAEQAFRRALETTGGTYNSARFNLGEVLLRLERDEEGVAMLREYLRFADEGATAERARALIRDPRRAREAIVPEIRLTTVEGETLTDEGLAGRVVLFDFWATWCAPCVAALPAMQRLSQRMEGGPFVLVSVSFDARRETLESFLAERDSAAGWMHCWNGDAETSLDETFGISKFPTYVLVGADGRILHRVSGWSDRVSRTLSGEVAAAVRRARKREP